MKLKPGVRLHGLKPEILFALTVLDRLWPTEMVVTSLIDGAHGRGSLHYVGQAADIRVRDLEPEEIAAVVREAKAALGADFDVVLEPSHLHVEFQPKDPY